MPSKNTVSGIALQKQQEDRNIWSRSQFFLIKNVLFIINVASLLIGTVIIAVGSTLSDSLLAIDIYSEFSMIVILTGILVTSLGLVGCIGAVSERGIFLRSYIVCLSIAITGQILMGSFVLLRRDTVNAYTRDAWMASTGPNVKNVFNLQNTLKCCGYTKISDGPLAFNQSDSNFKKDLCPDDGPKCTSKLEVCSFKEPCGPKVEKIVVGTLLPLGVSGIVLGSIELLALLSCLVFLRLVAKKNGPSSKDLDDAWRINQDKIQIGYRNFEYA